MQNRAQKHNPEGSFVQNLRLPEKIRRPLFLSGFFLEAILSPKKVSVGETYGKAMFLGEFERQEH